MIEKLVAQFPGLNASEVAQRTSDGAVNRDPRSRTKAVGVIIAENTLTVFNAINALIIGTLAWLYIVKDDERLILDSLGILFVILANTVIAIVQEIRAYRALERALLTLTPLATVLRSGKSTSIAREDVVRDDLLLIQRGDVVSADGELVYSDGLELDESLLTGEVHPIAPAVGRVVHAATHCTAGVGVVRVMYVGAESMAARITAMAKRYSFAPSPMQRRVNRLFETWFFIALILAAVEVALNATTIFDNVDEIRRVATILVGLIPEGLVFFATITVALSVARIAKQGVVVQKLSSLESFAGADVVCMDKTGTLTENRLSVHGIEPLADVDENTCRSLLRAYADATSDNGQVIDALRNLPSTEFSLSATERFAFSSARKFSAIKTEAPTPWLVLGAADVVLTTSHPLWSVVKGRADARGWSDKRLLMLGASDDVDTPMSTKPLCWCALDDTIRSDARDALALFDEMGVRVIVLTGDAPGPAVSALTTLGRPPQPQQVHTATPTSSFKDSTVDGAVYARLLPDQKRDLVNALRKSHLHTIMIGDGVNDLPAIKEADVGIAMDGAAPITKEVADIVLDTSSFATLPELVGEGRAVIRTVLNVAKIFVSKNTVLVAMSLLASADLIPFPLTPRRGAFLSILCVGFPAMFLASQGHFRKRVTAFYRDLMTYVLASSTTAIGIAIAVHYSAPFAHANANYHAMLLTFTLIGSLLGSFVSVDLFVHPAARRVRITGILLLLTGLLIAAIPSSVPVINIIHTFYEIHPVNLAQLAVLALCAGAAFVTAAGVHRLARASIFSQQ